MDETQSNSRKLEKYRRMQRIRQFEDLAESIHAQGEIPGALHTYAGMEASGVGSCMALRDDDYMVGNHRSHGHPIAKGASLRPLMAELLGKASGVCKGKGGSMHLSDFSIGSLGETSIVGSGVPVAAGAALGAKLKKTGQVALCFFGDGATSEGAAHEGMNLAAAWCLPAVFVCENNLYGMSTPVADAVPVKDLADRAKAYAMKSIIVDGQDVDAVEKAVTEAVDHARSGKGPVFVETKTYRYGDHAVNMGRNLTPRQGEEEQWKARDPLVIYRQRLEEEGVDPAVLDTIESETADEVADAIKYARDADYPQAEEAFDDVFTDRLPVPDHLTA
ncbi:MAG: pyruvate dehydrogenase (acetyl-transferring) E1 component subunit alpha [Croceicoccus sp.]|nr:pyruvate dehydrogenase (acetyl-transferring) E1 component subunit alpha [Croceicoccus sp.]MAL25070.1 pyruvate dehydrogenase (acetyl-transferring) E1 component subunit alpha [Croceicoccus sp.]|tara:strand:+ start:69295 stop:70293 length:999 start_codon:yes stop_codon:yes gene_type:complete